MAREIEFKYLLSARAFEKLKQTLTPTLLSSVMQTNSYYDTASRQLARRRIALRIRQEKTRFTLTLKLPVRAKKNAPGLSVREEQECTLTKLAAQTLIKATRAAAITESLPWKKLVQCFPDIERNRLNRVAQMRTLRRSYRLPAKHVLELDEVHLDNGKVFFEVELESNRVALARTLLDGVFQAAGVQGRPVRRTKLARVMREQRK